MRHEDNRRLLPTQISIHARLPSPPETLTFPFLFNPGALYKSANNACPKSCSVSELCCDLVQSESYPKLWMRTCRNPASDGSHSFGQNVDGSDDDALHERLEPPFRP